MNGYKKQNKVPSSLSLKLEVFLYLKNEIEKATRNLKRFYPKNETSSDESESDNEADFGFIKYI